MSISHEHRIATADGRVLAGASHGPKDGVPVLFIAGAATGQQMTFGEDLLDRLGVRLLTMDRPGIGASSIDSERTLASTAADYRAFVTGAIGEVPGGIPTVANSQGSVFGLELAATGGTTRLVLASPADELAHPSIHAMLPPEATQLADLAASDPDGAAKILGGFSAEAMEEMVMGGSHPADAEFYRSEPFHTRYRAALAEGFGNGGAGYVADTLIAMRPWNIDLAAIDCPVQILFGAQDLTHSPDHGETLASRIPGASREVLEDAGGALLWTHAERVLGAALG